MEKHSLVRTIYLYTFALLGLTFLTIGGVRFVDMGLKAFVFTKAEEEERIMFTQPPFISPPVPLSEEIERVQKKEELELSEEEKILVKQCLTDYKDWKERRAQIDPVTANRHRKASLNLALILIGLPLYLYHWQIIKKETKDEQNNYKIKRI